MTAPLHLIADSDPVALAPERRQFTAEERAEFERKQAEYRSHRKYHRAMYPDAPREGTST